MIIQFSSGSLHPFFGIVLIVSNAIIHFEADCITFSSTFLILAASCTAAFIWATYFVPETANMSLEEVDRLLRASAGREEANLKSKASFFFL